MPMFRKKKDEDGSDEPSILSRWSSEDEGGSEPERAGGGDTAEPKQQTWLESSQASDSEGRDSSSDWAPQPGHDEQQQVAETQPEREPEPVAAQAQTQEEPAAEAKSSSPRVEIKEDDLPGGPPDLANYDPKNDAYNQNKIPGAQAREE